MALEVLNPFETAVVIVALIAGVWLWREWTSAATTKLTQSLFSRSAHRRGQAVTRARLTFTSDRSAAELAEALRRELGIPAGVRTLVFERPYVLRATPRTVEFAFGSRLHTSFRALVVVEDMSSGGCEGGYAVRAWRETHGLVNDLDQLQVLQLRVAAALAELGATVAVVVPEPAHASVARRRRSLRLPARPSGRRAAPAPLRLRRARS